MSDALTREKAARKTIEKRVSDLEERVSALENVPPVAPPPPQPSADDLDATALEQSVKDKTESAGEEQSSV